MYVFFLLLGFLYHCGAQNYTVPIHEDTKAQVQTTNLPKTSPTLGIHSVLGWSDRLPIHFVTSQQLSNAHVAQLRSAMALWEGATGKTLFAYDGPDDKTGADFTSLYDPLSYSKNTHILDFNWKQNTGKTSSVLATTVWSNARDDSRQIVLGTIRYNAESYVFGDALSDSSVGEKFIVDMTSLALHELGHLLGLSHVSSQDDANSIMNPYLVIGEGAANRSLSAGDVERIRSIYTKAQ